MKKLDRIPKQKGFIARVAEWKLGVLDFFSPLSFVAVRIYMGLIFWKSGLTKIVDTDSTIMLFENEYQTHEKLTLFGQQFLTPEITAYSAIFCELVFSIMLIVGFGGRQAAFFLLCLTGVIHYSYNAGADHITWAVMLSLILFCGAGRASWDHFIRGTVMQTIDSASLKEKSFAALCTMCVTLYAGYLIFNDVIKP